MMAGGVDNIIPPSLTRTNTDKYARDTHSHFPYWPPFDMQTRNVTACRYASGAPTAFLEVPGRTHFTVVQPGWEAVCDTVLAWIARQHIEGSPAAAGAPAAPAPAAIVATATDGGGGGGGAGGGGGHSSA